MALVSKVNLQNCEVIPRSYGRLYLLSERQAGFQNLQVLLMVIEPNSRTSKHYHPSEEVFYVIAGHVTFHTDGLSIQASAQDAVIVPPNRIHQVENVSDKEKGEILIALSPPRDASKVIYCD